MRGGKAMQMDKSKIKILMLSILVLIISLTFFSNQSFAEGMTAKDLLAEAKKYGFIVNVLVSKCYMKK